MEKKYVSNSIPEGKIHIGGIAVDIDSIPKVDGISVLEIVNKISEYYSMTKEPLFSCLKITEL